MGGRGSSFGKFKHSDRGLHRTPDTEIQMLDTAVYLPVMKTGTSLTITQNKHLHLYYIQTLNLFGAGKNEPGILFDSRISMHTKWMDGWMDSSVCVCVCVCVAP